MANKTKNPLDHCAHPLHPLPQRQLHPFLANGDPDGGGKELPPQGSIRGLKRDSPRSVVGWTEAVFQYFEKLLPFSSKPGTVELIDIIRFRIVVKIRISFPGSLADDFLYICWGPAKFLEIFHTDGPHRHERISNHRLLRRRFLREPFLVEDVTYPLNSRSFDLPFIDHHQIVR